LYRVGTRHFLARLGNKQGDREAHGKAVERHSSCIESAVGIFLARLGNKRAWLYAIITWNKRRPVAVFSPSDEAQHTKKRDTDELVLTVKVEKIKAMAATLGCSTLEIERSNDSNKQQRWFSRLEEFRKPKAPFTVKDQWDWWRDAEQRELRASAPSSRRCPRIPEAWTTEFRVALDGFLWSLQNCRRVPVFQTSTSL
jgi:hypothetical protein